MKQKPQLLASSVLVAMALGTAWAVRGKFGHVSPTFAVKVEPPFQQAITFITAVLILAASAFVMIHSHGELKGSQIRFER